MTALGHKLQWAAFARKLRANAARRGEAAAELNDARAELAALVREGRRHKFHMTKICAEAGIGRERGYELLNGRERRSRDVYESEDVSTNEGGRA